MTPAVFHRAVVLPFSRELRRRPGLRMAAFIGFLCRRSTRPAMSVPSRGWPMRVLIAPLPC